MFHLTLYHLYKHASPSADELAKLEKLKVEHDNKSAYNKLIRPEQAALYTTQSDDDFDNMFNPTQSTTGAEGGGEVTEEKEEMETTHVEVEVDEEEEEEGDEEEEEDGEDEEGEERDEEDGEDGDGEEDEGEGEKEDEEEEYSDDDEEDED